MASLHRLVITTEEEAAQAGRVIHRDALLDVNTECSTNRTRNRDTRDKIASEQVDGWDQWSLTLLHSCCKPGNPRSINWQRKNKNFHETTRMLPVRISAPSSPVHVPHTCQSDKLRQRHENQTAQDGGRRCNILRTRNKTGDFRSHIVRNSKT